MTSTAENKTIVDEFIQPLFTKADLLAVDRYLADDFAAHDPPMADLSGDAAGFRDAAATLRAVFLDFAEHAQVGARKLRLASNRMLIPRRKACRYREP